MKIWYEHLFGKLDKQDIQVVKVWADPQPQEYEDALAQGFVQLDEGWQQVFKNKNRKHHKSRSKR